MADRSPTALDSSSPRHPPPTAAQAPDLTEYPVREYIGAMAVELAQMARWDGDEQLACALDIAATLAGEPFKPARPEPAPDPDRPS